MKRTVAAIAAMLAGAAVAGPVYTLNSVPYLSAAIVGSKVIGGLCAPDTFTCGLWVTDGTASGTREVMPPAGRVLPRWGMVSSGGIAYFIGRQPLGAGPYGDDTVWRTDGTGSGTFPVLSAPRAKSFVVPATAGGRLIYLSESDGVWRTDGTAGGTLKLSTTTLSVTGAGGLVYFEGSDGQLWRSDGTSSGTLAVASAGPDKTAGSVPYYYVAPDASAVMQLWATDGTAAGTRALVPMSHPAISVQAATYAIIFQPSSESTRLWRTDGTAAGTSLIGDFQFTITAPDPTSRAAVGDKVYFNCFPATGAASKLCSTDGTAAGTGPVAPGLNVNVANGFAVAGGVLYGVSGSVFRTQGTDATSFYFPDSYYPWAALGNQMLYARTGNELWITDGTLPGSRAVGSASGPTPTFNFTSATASVAENGSTTLTVTRTGSEGAVSVRWSTIAGTAHAGSDYGSMDSPVQPSGLLSWADGDATPRTIVVGGAGATIPLINNTIAQTYPRSFKVSLSNASPGSEVGASKLVTVEMTDDDVGYAFSQEAFEVSEAAGFTNITVRRTGPALAASSVRWTTFNYSAISGTDFGTRGRTAALTGLLSWAAGDNAEKTIRIPILQDSLVEGTEFFQIRLDPPSSVNLDGMYGRAEVRILDDEPALQALVSFTQLKKVVREGERAVVQVELTRLGFSDAPVTVSYTTQPGTAVAPSDYVAKSGTVHWEAGVSGGQVFLIDTVDNRSVEPLESFTVALSTTTPGARVETREMTVVIVDKDEVFPAAGMVPFDWLVPAGAAAGWHASTDAGAYEGFSSLRSDQIEDGQAAQIEVTRTFAAGTLTFRLKISSEPTFDKLRFFVDGIEKGSWSGTSNTAWQLFSMPITAGDHTLRWSYEKDSSASLGYDSAWIDAVTLP